MILFSRNCCVVGGDLKSYLYRDLFIPARRRRKFLGFQQQMLRKIDGFSVEITHVFAGKVNLVLKNTISAPQFPEGGGEGEMLAFVNENG